MKIQIFKKADNTQYKLIKSDFLKQKKKMKDIDFKYYAHLASAYDSIGYLDESVGKELENLFADSEFVIGIHYTGRTVVSEDYLHDTFSYGLSVREFKNKEEVDTTDLSIDEAVTLCFDPVHLIGKIKTAHEYKDSKGCVIIKIPKSYLGLEEGPIQPIYYLDDLKIRIIGECVYGYIPVSKLGKVEKIFHNSYYSNRHSNPETIGTFYDSALLNKKKK